MTTNDTFEDRCICGGSIGRNIHDKCCKELIASDDPRPVKTATQSCKHTPEHDAGCAYATEATFGEERTYFTWLCNNCRSEERERRDSFDAAFRDGLAHLKNRRHDSFVVQRTSYAKTETFHALDYEAEAR